jgi:hypothetical protein
MYGKLLYIYFTLAHKLCSPLILIIKEEIGEYVPDCNEKRGHFRAM